MNIVFLGLPGAGKGTQASFISQKLGMVHFSPGDILWDEIARKTPLGMEVHDNLSSGRLAPDWLVLRVLKDRLVSEKRGLLFDGFPRTMEQAEALDAWLASRSAKLNAVIHFELPEAEAAKRLVFRGREDDKPDIVKKRIMAYKDQTEPLLHYYRGNDILLSVNANQPQQAVTAQIALALKSVV